MTVHSFISEPPQGHMDRVKRIYAYLDKMRNVCIQFWTEEPDYSAVPDQKFDPGFYVYGEVKELIPNDTQTHLGKYVGMINYDDADIFQDQLTGCFVTGILPLVNKTPSGWYSNKHSCVETAIYGY